MQPVNPWLGLLLILVGVAAVALFARMHIDNALIPAAIITAGLGVIQAAQHWQATKQLGETRTELVTLQKSMRPPSLVDEGERGAKK